MSSLPRTHNEREDTTIHTVESADSNLGLTGQALSGGHLLVGKGGPRSGVVARVAPTNHGDEVRDTATFGVQPSFD